MKRPFVLLTFTVLAGCQPASMQAAVRNPAPVPDDYELRMQAIARLTQEVVTGAKLKAGDTVVILGLPQVIEPGQRKVCEEGMTIGLTTAGIRVVRNSEAQIPSTASVEPFSFEAERIPEMGILARAGVRYALEYRWVQSRPVVNETSVNVERSVFENAYIRVVDASNGQTFWAGNLRGKSDAVIYSKQSDQKPEKPRATPSR
ncbi:MAG: hypothetical protein VKP72_04050 [bacterium]|nr:hypothetical protein [bacterium]